MSTKRIRKPLSDKPPVKRTLEIVTIPDLCKGTTCRICLVFCKNDVLDLTTETFNVQGNHYVQVVADDRCDECLDCYRHCPEFAIFFRSRSAGPSKTDKNDAT